MTKYLVKRTCTTLEDTHSSKKGNVNITYYGDAPLEKACNTEYVNFPCSKFASEARVRNFGLPEKYSNKLKDYASKFGYNTKEEILCSVDFVRDYIEKHFHFDSEIVAIEC